MARTQPAAADEPSLAPFEGKDVLSTAVSVTRAGDGLSKALKVEPREMHVGETGVMVLEYEVCKVRFDPVPDTSGLQRVHILVAGTATFIDEDLVRDALDAQQRKIDADNGVFHLPFSGVEGQDDEGDGGEGAGDDEWEDPARTDDTAGG